MLNFHDTRLFLDVSFIPLQLILFFDLFFSFCICTALVQDQVINFLPVGVSFRLIINQFIWIWLFLTSFRAEVCEEQEWRVGSRRPRAYAVVLRQGNVMETDTPNRRGYECQSVRTFENFSSNAQLRGLFRQLLHAFL